MIATSGSPKTMKRLPAPVFLSEFVAHRQVGVHLGRQHGQLAVALCLFGDVRVEGESADDEHVEADALHRFLGGFLHLLRADGAVLRADGDGHSPGFAVGVGVFASGVEPCSGIGVEPVEAQPFALASVLHARLLEVLQDHGCEVLLLAGLLFCPGAVLILIGRRQHAMRREALHRERAAHPHTLVVFVGLIVQRFGLGIARDSQRRSAAESCPP